MTVDDLVGLRHDFGTALAWRRELGRMPQRVFGEIQGPLRDLVEAGRDAADDLHHLADLEHRRVWAPLHRAERSLDGIDKAMTAVSNVADAAGRVFERLTPAALMDLCLQLEGAVWEDKGLTADERREAVSELRRLHLWLSLYELGAAKPAEQVQ